MIINIHGFSSSGRNAKFSFLQEVFSEEKIVSPDLAVEPMKAIDQLQTYIEEYKTEPILLVGASLGGFYAYYLSAMYRCHAVLLNPSLLPFATLMDCLGNNVNYNTGEPFTFTTEHVKQLRDLFQNVYLEGDPALLHAFVCEDDERIDHRQTEKMLAGCATYRSFATGGHRFEELSRITNDIRGIYHTYVMKSEDQ